MEADEISPQVGVEGGGEGPGERHLCSEGVTWRRSQQRSRGELGQTEGILRAQRGEQDFCLCPLGREVDGAGFRVCREFRRDED